MMIVAFLQNQWFKDPARMRQILATQFKGDRESFERTFLFFGCLTGRRLMIAFGEELCDRIVWSNASPLIAGQSDDVFPPDPSHMASVIRKHTPQIVLLFGAVAQAGMADVIPILRRDVHHVGFQIIAAPHPAARGALTTARLAAAAKLTREYIQLGEAVPA
jgi:hypothetical protein